MSSERLATGDEGVEALPPGWQGVGWYGFSLAVPAEWNVTFHRGEAKEGALALANLREMRLEVRWRGYWRRGAARRLARLRKRFVRAKMRLTELPAAEGMTMVQVHAKEGALVLVQSGRRLYELSWPRRAEHVEAIAATFRDHTAQGKRARWPWRIYAAEAWVPARYRLKRVSLLPGATELEFARFRRRVALGSFSLADRFLGGASVRDWARRQVSVVRAHPGGRWESVGSMERYAWEGRTGLFRLRRKMTVTFRHDAGRNVIQWTQSSVPTGWAEEAAEMI